MIGMSRSRGEFPRLMLHPPVQLDCMHLAWQREHALAENHTPIATASTVPHPLPQTATHIHA